MRKAVLVVIIILLTAGCGGGSKKIPFTPLAMTLDVRSDPAVNNGEVFWMVVKEVDENEFSYDSYDAIAAIVASDTWGPDVLTVCSIVPGRERRLIINQPTYRSAGFYFLFSNPQEYWKVLTHQPIGNHAVLHIEQYKAWVTSTRSTF